MSNSETALNYFGQGFNCSQAVLSAYAPALGLPAEQAQRVAAAFGGGIARSGGICGAATGALMALGLKRFRVVQDKSATAALARDFLARFKAAHGSIMCRDLLGYDISTDAGHKQAADAGAFKTVCCGLVRSAAQILEQMLAEIDAAR